jgi:hypothetical protein
MVIGNRPFFDFFERSKAAEAVQVIVQAAVSYARRLNIVVDVSHWGTNNPAFHIHAPEWLILQKAYADFPGAVGDGRPVWVDKEL